MLQVTFIEHDIPNASLSVISNKRVFYHHNNQICSFDLISKKHMQLFQIERPLFLFSVFDTHLLFINGNTLRIFNHSNFCSETKEIKLKGIPLNAVQWKDQLIFIYKNSVELLLFKNKTNPYLVKIELEQKIKDICCSEEHSFLLTEDNKILRTKNLFTTQTLLSLTQMSFTGLGHQKINFYGDCLFLQSKTAIEKYEVEGKFMRILYSFSIENMSVFMNGFLLSSSLVHLDKAPFKILEDQIFGFSGADESIGVSKNRVYFIKNVQKENKNAFSYEMSSFGAVVNPNTIQVPEFVKDEKQRVALLRNESELRKYEILLKKVSELEMDLNRRETEVKGIYEDLTEKLEQVNKKTREIEERVRTVRKKAENTISGSSSEFYKRISQLERILEKMPEMNLGELSEKLRAQRAALLSKFDS